jgi:phage gp29-like protein
VAIANLTSSQLNSAQLKALWKEQEQAQAEAQEKKTRDDAEKEQKHLANMQVRHEANIGQNDELPPCPLHCRGEECTVECTTNLV